MHMVVPFDNTLYNHASDCNRVLYLHHKVASVSMNCVYSFPFNIHCPLCTQDTSVTQLVEDLHESTTIKYYGSHFFDGRQRSGFSVTF